MEKVRFKDMSFGVPPALLSALCLSKRNAKSAYHCPRACCSPCNCPGVCRKAPFPCCMAAAVIPRLTQASSFCSKVPFVTWQPSLRLYLGSPGQGPRKHACLRTCMQTENRKAFVKALRAGVFRAVEAYACLRTCMETEIARPFWLSKRARGASTSGACRSSQAKFGILLDIAGVKVSIARETITQCVTSAMERRMHWLYKQHNHLEQAEARGSVASLKDHFSPLNIHASGAGAPAVTAAHPAEASRSPNGGCKCCPCSPAAQGRLACGACPVP
eukprot:scaffold44634_cov17-Tisochrysis_lutea.AAC.1